MGNKYKRNQQLQAPQNNQPGTQLVARETSFSGPIPHPDVLRGYDSIVPGAAERILKMAEDNAAFTNNQITQANNHVRHGNIRGQVMGFIITMTSLLLAGAAVYMNLPWVAACFTALNIPGIINALNQKKER